MAFAREPGQRLRRGAEAGERGVIDRAWSLPSCVGVVGESVACALMCRHAVLLLAFFFLPFAGSAQAPPASDWLTWGYDQERSGWNRAETTLSKENVPRLVLQWSAQLPVPARELAL